ncbi:Protein kinase domain-containing protein [Meloidogyne graminicola]|uniref:Protein kinase domain-containing protein n=1 Tax=Meloidogyne graminicola TaxID=189291 RepID=A0A8S9ZLN3_9BILA|nr:Protein kinase domain-containing protein [Meloidogyne graminicola]
MSKNFIVLFIMIFILLTVNGVKDKKKKFLKKLVSKMGSFFCTTGSSTRTIESAHEKPLKKLSSFRFFFCGTESTEYELLEDIGKPYCLIEEASTSNIGKNEGEITEMFISQGLTSSSLSRSDTCKCRKYRIDEFSNNINIMTKNYGNVELLYNKSELGKGGFGSVQHAFNPKIGCLALKVSNLRIGSDESEFCEELVNNEIEILKYFSQINNQHIIKYYGSIKIEDKMFIAMELGGQNLNDYFYQVMNENKQQRKFIVNQLVINISKCAAKALMQFHEYAIHLDIKSTNFILSSNFEAKRKLI